MLSIHVWQSIIHLTALTLEIHRGTSEAAVVSWVRNPRPCYAMAMPATSCPVLTLRVVLPEMSEGSLWVLDLQMTIRHKFEVPPSLCAPAV